MANKVAPKISAPGSDKFPTKGPHNPNVGTRGSGIAPKPRGGAAISGNDRPSMPSQGGLARVKGTGTGQANGRLPLRNPPANVVGGKIGQPDPASFNVPGPGKRVAPKTSLPVTSNALATEKPKRRGIGSAFYGEYK